MSGALSQTLSPPIEDLLATILTRMRQAAKMKRDTFRTTLKWTATGEEAGLENKCRAGRT